VYGKRKVATSVAAATAIMINIQTTGRALFTDMPAILARVRVARGGDLAGASPDLEGLVPVERHADLPGDVQRDHAG
jgi:hypothetical protein